MKVPGNETSKELAARESLALVAQRGYELAVLLALFLRARLGRHEGDGSRSTVVGPVHLLFGIGEELVNLRFRGERRLFLKGFA